MLLTSSWDSSQLRCLTYCEIYWFHQTKLCTIKLIDLHYTQTCRALFGTLFARDPQRATYYALSWKVEQEIVAIIQPFNMENKDN